MKWLITDIMLIALLIFTAFFISDLVDRAAQRREAAAIEFQEQRIDLLHPAVTPCEPEPGYRLEI